MTATCYVTFGQKYRNETHPLDDINRGYQDLRDGKNIRGVIDFT